MSIHINQYTSTSPATVSTVRTSTTSQTEQDVSSTKTAPAADQVQLDHDSQGIGSMNAQERTALVESLKSDLENQVSRFISRMAGTFSEQGRTYLTAGGSQFWQTIAQGNFQVDSQTQAEARQAISSDGYWGVEQTSQRIFDFACALAGDDVDKMRELQSAVLTGFQKAADVWGGDLPQISHDTLAAVNQKFDDYYASRTDGSV